MNGRLCACGYGPGEYCTCKSPQPTVNWSENFIYDSDYPPSSLYVSAESTITTLPLQKESVNHPEHYNPGVYEVINIIEHYKLGFHLGNTLKYMLRAGKKHDNIKEDIDKAIWYLQRYREKL